VEAWAKVRTEVRQDRGLRTAVHRFLRLVSAIWQVVKAFVEEWIEELKGLGSLRSRGQRRSIRGEKDFLFSAKGDACGRGGVLVLVWL
jgi:hypothetical protein